MCQQLKGNATLNNGQMRRKCKQLLILYKSIYNNVNICHDVYLAVPFFSPVKSQQFYRIFNQVKMAAFGCKMAASALASGVTNATNMSTS